MNFGYWLLGIIKRIRICTKKAMKIATFKLLYETIDDMVFNLKLWIWDDKEKLMKYNVKLVKNLIKAKNKLQLWCTLKMGVCSPTKVQWCLGETQGQIKKLVSFGPFAIKFFVSQ
jgi:hypothetical protein